MNGVSGSDSELKWVIGNLLGLLVAGVGASGWVLYFTDYFPVVGGLLGLGGLFAWIAFMGNILSETRKKQLQEGFDEKILRKGYFSVLIVAFVIGFPFYVSTKGTVMIDNLQGSRGSVVEISELAKGEGFASGEQMDRVLLLPQSKAKILLPTGWFGKRDYHVKVAGLPAIQVIAKGFRRTKLLVPDTFEERPVVLARPAAKHGPTVSEGDFMLEVLINKQPVAAIKDYRGQAVWVGAGADVMVPASLIEQWRFDLVPQGFPASAVSQWTSPVSLAPNLYLLPEMQVAIRLKRKSDQGIVFSGNHTIQPGKVRRFPEEVILEKMIPNEN